MDDRPPTEFTLKIGPAVRGDDKPFRRAEIEFALECPAETFDSNIRLIMRFPVGLKDNETMEELESRAAAEGLIALETISQALRSELGVKSPDD